MSDAKVPEGSNCLSERPLFCQQTISNRRNALVCGSCFRFLGSLQLQLLYLCRKISRQDNLQQLSLHSNHFLSEIVPCIHNCGEFYCSTVCREAHWQFTHNCMCTGMIPDEVAESHPLIQFKTHSIQSNEIFLLVGDVFTAIINEYQLNNTSSIYQTLQSYVRELWWDAAIAPPGTSARDLRMTLKRLSQESWKLLNKVLQLKEKQIDHILSAEYFSR